MAKLALLGGPALGAPAPEPHPRFTAQTIDRVGDLLRRGQTVGLNRNCAVIREAEAAIAAWHGVSECLGLSSGHAALHSALQGLGISTGDEVIVSPYTWGASVSCVLHAGAVPIFADVAPDTGLLDPASVEVSQLRAWVLSKLQPGSRQVRRAQLDSLWSTATLTCTS